MSRPATGKRKSRQYQRLPIDEPMGPPPLPPGLKHHKLKPNRTTKTSQKLTLFPDETPTSQPSQIPEDMLLPEAEDLYDQLTQVPPERIGSLDRKKLPRVTAYSTAKLRCF
jgi:uncharacterized Rmd1/YagE family protein